MLKNIALQRQVKSNTEDSKQNDLKNRETHFNYNGSNSRMRDYERFAGKPELQDNQSKVGDLSKLNDRDKIQDLQRSTFSLGFKPSTAQIRTTLQPSSRKNNVIGDNTSTQWAKSTFLHNLQNKTE